MKKVFKYRYFRESISYLLLIGIVLANVATYFPWVINPEVEIVEFCLAMENDSEENEGKTEVEKDNEISSESSLLIANILSSAGSKFNYSYFKFNFQPEIPTPPPENYLNFS